MGGSKHSKCLLTILILLIMNWHSHLVTSPLVASEIKLVNLTLFPFLKRKENKTLHYSIQLKHNLPVLALICVLFNTLVRKMRSTKHALDIYTFNFTVLKEIDKSKALVLVELKSVYIDSERTQAFVDLWACFISKCKV